MTEIEAKKKWCPMSRYYGGGLGGAAHNRTATSKSKCIASECMMWQWIYRRAPRIMEVRQPDIKTKEGYCGLIKT